MVYDEELIKDIIEDLSDSEPDKLVLFILHHRNRPVLRTRIQKEALIYNQAYTGKKNMKLIISEVTPMTSTSHILHYLIQV